MKLATMVSLLVILVATCNGGDLDLIQGTWKLVRFTRNETERTVAEGGQMLIAGEHFVEKLPNRFNGTLTLHSAAGTKRFEQSLADSDQKKSVLSGIYQLKDDTFRQCRTAGNDSILPLNFTAKKGSGQSLLVWKRVGKFDKSLAKSDYELLVGTWVLESLILDGWQPTEEKVKSYKLVVEEQGRHTFVTESISRGSLRLSEFTTPKQMDFDTITPDRSSGTIMPGIYRIDGNRLEVNRSLTSLDERPSQFGDTPKTLHLIYERCNP